MLFAFALALRGPAADRDTANTRHAPSKCCSPHSVGANNAPLAALDGWVQQVWWSCQLRRGVYPARRAQLYLEEGTLPSLPRYALIRGPGTWDLGGLGPSPLHAPPRSRAPGQGREVGSGFGGCKCVAIPWPSCETGRRPVTCLEQDNSTVKNSFLGCSAQGTKELTLSAARRSVSLRCGCLWPSRAARRFGPRHVSPGTRAVE